MLLGAPSLLCAFTAPRSTSFIIFFSRSLVSLFYDVLVCSCSCLLAFTFYRLLAFSFSYFSCLQTFIFQFSKVPSVSSSPGFIGYTFPVLFVFMVSPVSTLNINNFFRFYDFTLSSLLLAGDTVSKMRFGLKN